MIRKYSLPVVSFVIVIKQSVLQPKKILNKSIILVGFEVLIDISNYISINQKTFQT